MTHTITKKALLEFFVDAPSYAWASEAVQCDARQKVAEITSITIQVLEELKEKTVELPISSGDNMQLVPLKAIDNKIKELEDK